jgi:hypothetical protein
MVRRKQNQGSPMRMYRHFAVVTLVLTAAMAIFADGERRGAMAEEIAARQQRARLEQASVAKFGKPKLVSKVAQGPGSFAPDPGGYGEPMVETGGGNSSYIPEANGVQGRYVPAAYNRYGLTEDAWDDLSETEREVLRQEARKEAALAASSERQHQIELLRESSARRSGGEEEVD